MLYSVLELPLVIFCNLLIAMLSIWNVLGISYHPVALSTEYKYCLKHRVSKPQNLQFLIRTLNHRICLQQRVLLHILVSKLFDSRWKEKKF
jgi:hypothetical protein